MMAEAPSPDIELKNNNCKLVLRLLTINIGSALPTHARFPLVVWLLLLLLLLHPPRRLLICLSSFVTILQVLQQVI